RTAWIVAERGRMLGELAGMGIRTLESQSNFLMCEHPNHSAEAIVEHLFVETGIIANLAREAGLENYFRFSISEKVHNDLLLGALSELAD
ncbi:MAG: hypothetical protein AAF401_01370, partial [Pseudomonadota bacterium]